MLATLTIVILLARRSRMLNPRAGLSVLALAQECRSIPLFVTAVVVW